MPAGNIDIEFLNWLDISSSVEKASMLYLVCWISPPDNWLKLNCDRASMGNPGHSVGGSILRNSSGELMLAFGYYYGCKTSSRLRPRQ